MNVNKLKEKQKIAEHLHKSACGYGLKLTEIMTCVESIPDKLLQDFIYTLSKIAEKSGYEGFVHKGDAINAELEKLKGVKESNILNFQNFNLLNEDLEDLLDTFDCE